jgi:hypothetical protein
VDEVVLSLLTDELKEDGELAYLIAEYTAWERTGENKGDA